jgi:hypothetical protein
MLRYYFDQTSVQIADAKRKDDISKN